MRTDKLANGVAALAHHACDHGHGASLANCSRHMHGLDFILRIANQPQQLAHAIQLESVVGILHVANLFIVGAIMQPTQAQWIGRQIRKLAEFHFGLDLRLGLNGDLGGLHGFHNGLDGLLGGRS